jgi:hypothetical protein
MPEGLTGDKGALRSFVQVPIGAPDAPLGVLLLAKSEPASFDSNWCVSGAKRGGPKLGTGETCEA